MSGSPLPLHSLSSTTTNQLLLQGGGGGIKPLIMCTWVRASKVKCQLFPLRGVALLLLRRVGFNFCCFVQTRINCPQTFKRSFQFLEKQTAFFHCQETCKTTMSFRSSNIERGHSLRCTLCNHTTLSRKGMTFKHDQLNQQTRT